MGMMDDEENEVLSRVERARRQRETRSPEYLEVLDLCIAKTKDAHAQRAGESASAYWTRMGRHRGSA